MNRYASRNSSCRSLKRFSTWAWTDTSSAETGSSKITISGLSISARATAMRWRWPPENMWIAPVMLGAEPDVGEHAAHPRSALFGAKPGVHLQRLVQDAPTFLRD